MTAEQGATVIAEAVRLYADDDVVIDGYGGDGTARITESDDGYWVEARVWVPKNG